jgi:probable phosphoglycerate mutase
MKPNPGCHKKRELWTEWGTTTRAGGESGKEFRYRCERTFTGLAERHPGEVIVVVTHGGVLRRLFEFVIGLSGTSGRQFKRRSASINVFTFTHDSWALETWGDTSHLDTRQD